MLKVGDVLDLGIPGETCVVKKIPAETSGQSLEMEWELKPQTGGTPVHVHPYASESYHVLQGMLDVSINGVWKTLSVGEQCIVEKGVPHTYRNSGNETTRVYNIHQPAMKFDQYFESLHTLSQRGILKSNKITLKAMLYLSVLIAQHKDETRLLNPPFVVTRVCGLIGRLLKYRI